MAKDDLKLKELAYIFAMFAAFVVGAMALTFIIAIPLAYFEAQAYNRQTGASVTTWDAMFLDLRVQAEPKK